MSKGPLRIRDAAGRAFRKIYLWTSANAEDAASGPIITAGAGAPTGATNGGSVYLRTDGAAATTIYSYDTTTNSWTARA